MHKHVESFEYVQPSITARIRHHRHIFNTIRPDDMMTSQVTTENSVEQCWDDALCYTWPETVVQRVDQMKSQVL